MKAVTYHYIRDYSEDYPNFNYLSNHDFLNQLAYFQNSNIIRNKDQIYNSSNSNVILLTFDDGLKDHLNIAEVLSKQKLIGIFFIPTFQLEYSDFLDVHKIHLLTGKISPKTLLDNLNQYLKKNNINNFYNSNDELFYYESYKDHEDNYLKKKFKRIMNYYGKINLKTNIINYFLKKF